MFQTHRTLIPLATLVLLSASAVTHAQSTLPTVSRCDGPGAFSLRVNEELLRPGIPVEELQDPTPATRVVRTREQAAEAMRGVCQDPSTGLTVIESEAVLDAFARLPAEDGSTDGDEGPSEPRSPAPVGVDPKFGTAVMLDDGGSTNIVIGADQRVIQSPTTAFPFSGVVKLRMTYQNDPFVPKKVFGCTGTLIGGFHVLTAGHCMFKQPSGDFPFIFGWADSVVVIPGLDGTTQPFGATAVTKPLRSFKSWTQDADVEGDIALITLNKTFNLGTFGLLYLSDATLDQTNAQLIGYPGDLGSPAGSQQAYVPGGGAITGHDSGKVSYKIDTNNGQSGSGVYRFWNGKRAVFSVHHGSCGSENCGARITKSRHDTIRGWQCTDGQKIAGICP
jgi:V8-like Glu-specific endopeptidase